MSYITPASLGRPGVVSVLRNAAARRPTPTPVLISRHEVAFSTEATSATPTHRRWLDITGRAGLGRILSVLTQPRLPRPRHEPDYFGLARMSREMDRL
ncbi:hypothetical protein HNP02_000347 [Mycobacterium sp. AZCC_0083]|nr:hypothetical protein [Mycobacterium sp. AZCC_0083]